MSQNAVAADTTSTDAVLYEQRHFVLNAAFWFNCPCACRHSGFEF